MLILFEQDISPKGSSSSSTFSSCESTSKATYSHQQTPSPTRKSKSEPSKNFLNDPVINQIQTTNYLPGFRSRNITYSFTEHYHSRRRKRSLNAGRCLPSSESRSIAITHSTQLSFLDFVDLFKAFELRCRKDLKDLFEQFAITKTLAEIEETVSYDHHMYKPSTKDMGKNVPLFFFVFFFTCQKLESVGTGDVMVKPLNQTWFCRTIIIIIIIIT